MEYQKMVQKKAEPKESRNVVSARTIQQSAIQQGSPHASQTLTISIESKRELEGVMTKLLASLDQLGLGSNEAGELKGNAEAVQALLKTEKPKSSIIRECLVSIKDVLQASATAAAASGAGQLVTSLLEEINKLL